MANITLMGASYTDVPAVTLPKTGGGTESFYDLSSDTVTSADHIMSGYIGHLADGSRVTGTGSGGSSSGQTKTGTVTGDGTTTLQISCSFKPDLIYVYGDMSDAVSNRGVTSVTIIKDEFIDVHSDASSSADSESLLYVSHDVTGYNENDSSNPHASYSNGTLTIDMVANSASTRFRSGQVYTYELSTVGTGSGGSANVGTKTITANGTYDAGDDSLDGYSEVTVNVPDPADYTSASTALGISKPITSGIEALTTYANEITGESDTTLSDAVRSLADGYGQGGGSATPPWVSSVETVTIGANTVTNASGVKTYFNSYTPYFAVVLKSAPTTNNQIVAMVNNGASALRYRNGAINTANVASPYDAVLVEGTQYDVYHF